MVHKEIGDQKDELLEAALQLQTQLRYSDSQCIVITRSMIVIVPNQPKE